MNHALAEQRFRSCEDVKKWVDEWFAAKGEDFYWCAVHKLPERGGKCITSDEALFIILPNVTCFFREKIRISYLYIWYIETICVVHNVIFQNELIL